MGETRGNRITTSHTNTLPHTSSHNIYQYINTLQSVVGVDVGGLGAAAGPQQVAGAAIGLLVTRTLNAGPRRSFVTMAMACMAIERRSKGDLRAI
jgi:hypothetical protein